MEKIKSFFNKDHMVKRILMSIFGVLICGVALIISNKWHVGKFKYVRIVTDVICVILGVILYFLSGSPVSGIGAVVGAGTIITAFFMGPLVDFFARKLAKPFLYGKGQEGT